MLTDAHRRAEALLASAVRAGAEVALSMVVSWYPDLDLGLLGPSRVGSEADLEAAWEEVSRRAAVMSSWVNPLHFVPAQDETARKFLWPH